METNWLCRIGRRMGLRARAAVLAMFFALTATALTGCGGGGSGTSAAPPAPVTVAGYFYNLPLFQLPCCSLASPDGSMSVAADGTTYLAMGSRMMFVGHLTFTPIIGGLMQVNGSGSVYQSTAYGGVPLGSSSSTPISGVTLTGTMSGTAFMATLSVPGMGDYSADAVYNAASAATVSLAGLAGNYAAGQAQLTIDANGVITGSDWNCPSYNGQAALPNAAYDVYRITLTCTPASSSPYTLTGLTARGSDNGTAGATGVLVFMLADPASGRSVYMRLARQ